MVYKVTTGTSAALQAPLLPLTQFFWLGSNTEKAVYTVAPRKVRPPRNQRRD